MIKTKKHLLSSLAALLIFCEVGFLCLPLVHAVDVDIELLETPASIVVTPSSAAIDIDETQAFTATATYSGATPDTDVTNDPLTTWASEDTDIATVDNDGVATGISDGITTITATYGAVVGSADLTVGAGVAPSPTPPTPGPTPTPSPTPTPTPTPTPPSGGGGDSGSDGDSNPAPDASPSPSPPSILSSPPPTNPGPPPPGDEGAGSDSADLDQSFASSPEGDVPDGSGSNSSTSTNSAIVNGTPVSEFQISAPSELEQLPIVQTELGPVILPPELSVTRGEILASVMNTFGLEQKKQELLASCYADLQGCLSIFLSVSSFEDVVVDADLNRMQLYPDVAGDIPFAKEINIATLLGIVQGYYEEPQSPFKPFQVITRIEAVKVLLGSVDLVGWIYYDELEATLGGPQYVRAQTTAFADIDVSKGYGWWFPRYLNVACDVKMVDCSKGATFRPNDYITEAELQGMVSNLKLYLNNNAVVRDLAGDRDKDSLKTYMEQDIYATNPDSPDTDNDKLQDKEEVIDYDTSPFLGDSDGDGLSDYEEVKIYSTDPLQLDSDGDDFTDFNEITLGTNPKDPLSFPNDADRNGVSDEWESRYGLQVKDGGQDTDLDGISDKLEYQIGTDPTNVDSDGDGFTDAEEYLELRSSPTDASDPGDAATMAPRITNFNENQLVADVTPLIKGFAPAGGHVRLILRNDFGHEKVLGDAIADENNIFIFQVEDPLRDGRYQLIVRLLDPANKSVVESEPVHIILDSTLDVASPEPTQLADQNIDETIILKNIRVEIQDRKPVIRGETEFGSKVTATWRSLVTTSALIADNVSGEFALNVAQELPLGDHEVYVSATRKKDGAQSDSVRILFSIEPSFTESLLGVFGGGNSQEGESRFTHLVNLVSSKQVSSLLIVLVAVGLLSGVGYLYVRVSRTPARKKVAKK